jgi:hypothetical protein
MLHQPKDAANPQMLRRQNLIITMAAKRCIMQSRASCNLDAAGVTDRGN